MPRTKDEGAPTKTSNGHGGAHQMWLAHDVWSAADAVAVKETKRTGRAVNARRVIEAVLREHYGLAKKEG